MFKVGDVVEGVSDHYWVTKKGWVGVVTEIYSKDNEDHHPEGSIKVYGPENGLMYYFVVNPKDFKLHEPKLITTTESYV